MPTRRRPPCAGIAITADSDYPPPKHGSGDPFGGAGHVTHYRLYKLREAKGRIVKGKDVEAADDRAAMRAANADPDCPVCEVWRGAQKVGDVL